MTTSYPPFAERLLTARALRGLTQVQLGARASLDATAISHFEREERGPSMNNLRRLALALDVTVDYLLGLSEVADGRTHTTALMDQLGKLSFDEQGLVIDFIGLVIRRRSVWTSPKTSGEPLCAAK
jgi:transcriptional regulator with XRE-family HTH domain